MKNEIAQFNKLFEPIGASLTCTLEWINGRKQYHLVLSQDDYIPTHYKYATKERVESFINAMLDKYKEKVDENVNADVLVGELVRHNIRRAND